MKMVKLIMLEDMLTTRRFCTAGSGLFSSIQNTMYFWRYAFFLLKELYEYCKSIRSETHKVCISCQTSVRLWCHSYTVNILKVCVRWGVYAPPPSAWPTWSTPSDNHPNSHMLHLIWLNAICGLFWFQTRPTWRLLTKIVHWNVFLKTFLGEEKSCCWICFHFSFTVVSCYSFRCF